MDAVLSNVDLQEEILAAQDAALDRLRRRDFAGTLLTFVDRVSRSPQRPHPAVAFDFWDQFAEAEQLEELRLHRPAAYRALPVEEKNVLEEKE